jgi:hypothetical protein
MSIVKFLCRYAKDSTDKASKAIEDELKVQEIIQGDKFDKEAEFAKLMTDKGNWDYGPMAINLKDIMIANQVDDEHTCVRFYNGVTYVFKVNFDMYEALYQALIGQIVHDFTAPENQTPYKHGAR